VTKDRWEDDWHWLMKRRAKLKVSGFRGQYLEEELDRAWAKRLERQGRKVSPRLAAVLIDMRSYL